MAFLGSLAGLWMVLAVVIAVAGYPVVIFLHALLRLRRAWRAEHRPTPQPYDDAFDRELWDIATVNGREAARRQVEGL